MEYVYAAMLLHKAGQKVEEASLAKVLEAAGAKPDTARTKAVVAALDGVDIDQAVKDAATAPVAAAPAAPAEGKAAPEAKKEDEKKKAEDDKKSEEQAAAGLGSLFG